MEPYTVLMSVYEKEVPEFFQKSLESILKQTYAPSQIVVVKDGPLTEGLDGVLETVTAKHPNLFTIVPLEENVGLAGALNQGLPYCKNSLIGRMDSDDIALPERFFRQVEAMEHRGYELCSGTVLEFEEDPMHPVSKRILPETKEEIIRFSKRRNPFNHPAVMFRKELVEAVGGYPSYPFFEDYALWMEILARDVSVGNLAEPLVYMRVGHQMYERRGGRSYVKKLWNFKKHLYQKGWMSWSDFVISAGGHVVIALLPKGLRKKFYERNLRGSI